MDFIKITKTSRFLDPAQGFTETRRYSEVRVDPLTGRSTRILNFPIRDIIRGDVSAQVESSRNVCPFCPDLMHLVTPKFHPDLLSRGRYITGEAMCVPNVFPYDENGAVCIMCREHYLPLTAFTEEIIRNALQCCFEYLKDVVVRQPDMIYQSVNWNYMPLAGGSLIHPHLQITASSSSTNYYTDMVPALARYQEKFGRDYWTDLREEEARLQERCMAVTGHMTWLVDFAPLGVFDALGVFHDCAGPEDIRDAALDDLVRGMLHVMRYIDSLNMGSLNMSLYFLLGDPLFTPHVRICPRVSIPPYDASQINYMKMLHNESLTTLRPEAICDELKVYWHD